MTGRVAICAFFIVWPFTTLAQQAETLTDAQRTGRQLFEQSCGICHTRPTLTSPLYGPALSRKSLGGKVDVMRDVISNGSPHMPGFRHMFDHSQIDAIVAYLQTMPKMQEDAPR